MSLASKRGFRREIRKMMANIKPRNESKLVALRQNNMGSYSLEAGQRFGAVREEAERPASGAETSGEQRHGQPAETGRE